MRCRTCGGALRTVETRAAANGFIAKRLRECPRKHRYWTYEVDDSLLKTVIKFAERPGRIDQIEARVARYYRDQQIIERAKTEKHSVIAAEFGLSDNMVSTIVKRGLK